METLAKKYETALYAQQAAEFHLEEAIESIFGFGPLDQTWWEDLSYDPVDWDGFSVEFKDVDEGHTPTPEQLEALWALGFTVVRLFMKDSKSVSGDWWQVKGIAEPKRCRCSEEVTA